MKLIPYLIILFISLKINAQQSVDKEIENFNQQIDLNNYPMPHLTREHFEKVIQNEQKFFFPKKKRYILEQAINGILTTDAKFEFQIYSDFDIYRLNLTFPLENGLDANITLVEKGSLAMYTPEQRAKCSNNPGLCTEPFFWNNLKTTLSLIPEFEYRINELDLTYTEEQIKVAPYFANFTQTGLQIQVKVTAKDISKLVNYFGKGQDPQKIKYILLNKLGNSSEVWMDIVEIMPPAVKTSLYRFPSTWKGEFDVCYNAASTFYNLDHKQGNNDKSVLESIVNASYCKVHDINDLRFGDILYSGFHVVRYIMYDAKNDRHIVYQMNSGGWQAWRFLYLKEAFYPAFENGESHTDAFSNFYDAYYRCL